MRLIDADALIDRIKNPYEQAQVARWVNEQPTIEPEKRTEKRTETRACDLISRQAAINAAALSAAEWDGMYVQDINGRIREALEKLPPAQPEITEEAVKEYCRKRCLCVVDGALLKKYASAQSEEAIPVSWIKSRIERFKAEDNAFCGLTANIMHVMLNEWKREQEGETE